MKALIGEHKAHFPAYVDWESLENLNFDSELDWLSEQWLTPILDDGPPPEPKLRALWFGLFMTSRDGEPSYGMNFGGSHLFHLDGDADWAAAGLHWAEHNRPAKSDHLHALWEFGDEEVVDVQNLALGYAVITAANLLEQAGPALSYLGGSKAKPLGVAVSWNSGNPVYIGFIDQNGFRRRPAAKVKYR